MVLTRNAHVAHSSPTTSLAPQHERRTDVLHVNAQVYWHTSNTRRSDDSDVVRLFDIRQRRNSDFIQQIGLEPLPNLRPRCLVYRVSGLLMLSFLSSTRLYSMPMRLSSLVIFDAQKVDVRSWVPVALAHATRKILERCMDTTVASGRLSAFAACIVPPFRLSAAGPSELYRATKPDCACITIE